MKTIRIGSGAGYAGDRLEPSLELIEKGNLDYISYECLAAKRTEHIIRHSLAWASTRALDSLTLG